MENLNEKKFKVTQEKIAKANFELQKSEFNDIENEKKIINEELERGKRYLIEEVLIDGNSLLEEIDLREKKKKSLWNKFMDFIFK